MEKTFGDWNINIVADDIAIRSTGLFFIFGIDYLQQDPKYRKGLCSGVGSRDHVPAIRRQDQPIAQESVLLTVP